MNFVPLPHETLTSQGVDRIRRRRYVFHQAMLNEHAGDLNNFPDLLADVNASPNEIKKDKVDASRLQNRQVTEKVIEAANDSIKANEMMQQQLIAQAQAAVQAARGEVDDVAA